ncbi:MAG: hypothetical protein QXU88_02640 [Candidatus Woesearchaeota archaeon]
MVGKRAFLQRLTAQKYKLKSLLDKERLEGSSPPSVFIGRDGYPNVFAGPMLTQETDSQIYDAPEKWVGRFSKDEIINFRLKLVRGMQRTKATDVDNQLIQKLQEIALSKRSLLANAEFEHKPRGITFSEDHQPFGPSGKLKSIEIENAKWHKDLEKAHYDTDMRAAEAVVELARKGLEFTTIQRALSTGAFGLRKKRRIVPTRWSITATDDILGKAAIAEVRELEPINEFRIYESYGMDNYFAVLLTPGKWQYEAIEAFINVIPNKTFTFSDFEGHFGRKVYSEMGGCYYAQRNVVAEHLSKKGEQAGAFVFREVYEGYIPTGVWLCRELTKQALRQDAKTFKTMKEALQYLNTRLKLGIAKHKAEMKLINSTSFQKTLCDF